jgi:hypothetical protein
MGNESGNELRGYQVRKNTLPSTFPSVCNKDGKLTKGEFFMRKIQMVSKSEVRKIIKYVCMAAKNATKTHKEFIKSRTVKMVSTLIKNIENESIKYIEKLEIIK